MCVSLNACVFALFICILYVCVHLDYTGACVYLNVHTNYSASGIFSGSLESHVVMVCQSACREHTHPYPLCLCNCSCLCGLYVLRIAICVVHTGLSQPTRMAAWRLSIFQPYVTRPLGAFGSSQWPRCTVVCTSHQVFMPTIDMWLYLSPWPRPYCVPVTLSVTKRLLGTNPSCHNHQWIIATSLSPFMTHAHICYQLHRQQTGPYTHSLPPAQWITSN